MGWKRIKNWILWGFVTSRLRFVSSIKNKIVMDDMKQIPICISCNVPLKIKNGYARFRCMCDEEIRMIHVNCLFNNPCIKNIDVEDDGILSELFIKDFLTNSCTTIQ